MKLAIIGYGKMGRLIEETARERGHEIVAVVDIHNPETFDSEEFRCADVAIEFTVPASGEANIKKCFSKGIPVVSGTTGFGDALPGLRELCMKGEGTLLHATNFSIGVNIFMALNRYLASIMREFPAYRPYMTETHHIHKIDHPSGTAVTLADDLVKHHGLTTGWYDPAACAGGDGMMPVSSVREGEVPGIHTIKWISDVDSISISHSAKSRKGFALGAVLAAEWLASRKGFHTIDEMYSEFFGTNAVS